MENKKGRIELQSTAFQHCQLESGLLDQIKGGNDGNDPNCPPEENNGVVQDDILNP